MKKAMVKAMLESAKQTIKDAGLYIVPKEKFDYLADVAADAYRDYPLHCWLGKGKDDAVMSKLIMKITLLAMKNNAIVYADSEEMKGFAVCLPPGFTGSKTIPFLLNGGMRLVFHSGLKVIGRMLSYETYAMKLKKKYTNNEDWYIYNLSVIHEEQGNGIATKLLKPMLEYCDMEKKTVYLETNKEKNVDIYKHFGFEVALQGNIPKSDVGHYAMVKR